MSKKELTQVHWLKQFAQMRAAFDDMTNEKRQYLVDHWCVVLRCEWLKSMGFMEGSIDVDANIVRLMYGYAIGRGLCPREDEATIQDHVELVRRKDEDE